MIVSLFKTNQISGIVFLFLFQALLFMNAFLHPLPPVDLSNETPLYTQLIAPVLTYKWIQLAMAFMLIFFQALLYNYLIIQLNILGKTTYLPAFFYVVVSGMLPGNLYLNSGMLAMSFALIALFIFFRVIGSKHVVRHVFYTAVVLSLGSLFYFPLIYFLVFLWFALMILGQFSMRRWLASLLGFLLPYTYVLMFYYWNNGLLLYWRQDVLSFLGLMDGSQLAGISWAEIVLYVLLAGIMISGTLKYLRTRNGYKVIQRKIYNLFGFFLFVVLVSGALLPYFNRHHIVLLAFPAGVFLSFYFLNLRRKWVADIITLLLFTSMVALQFEIY